MPSLKSSKSLHAHKCMSGWLFKVSTIYTVGPCILDQIDRLWGLTASKPMILFRTGSNVTLGRCIGLQHIQKSATHVKNCGLQGSFLKPRLKDPFCPVKQTKFHISVISLLVKMIFNMSKHVRVALNVYQTSSRDKIKDDMSKRD